MKTILLDIGGTYIKCADGRQIPAHSTGTAQEIAGALRSAVGMPGQAGHDGGVTPDLIGGPDAIGAAIPGPFDYGSGTFLMKHKYASVYGQDFRTLAGVPDEVEIKFRHDVVAQLEGGIRMLGLEGQNVALVTLGTGLGFAHAVAGQVQCGPQGSPARGLWNLPIPEGGILEDLISARGISATYASLSGGSGLDPLTVSRLARMGDKASIATYRQTGARLGLALKDLLGELRIGTLLMGGQISGSLDLMLEPLQEAAGCGIRILRSPEGAVFEGLKCLFT